jgi:V/A-type H+-transporting ATPase subunit A
MSNKPSSKASNMSNGKKNNPLDAKVIAAQESLVTIEVPDKPIVMNEVGYIHVGEDRLKAEVLRVRGKTADMQVFEDTQGVRIGDSVELTGALLSVTLGPGLLGQVFDGLQNPLEEMAQAHGFFIKRGMEIFPLDKDKLWDFSPLTSIGDRLVAGQPVGQVKEGVFEHKIMVPFQEAEPVELTWIRQGKLKVNDPVARFRRSDGSEQEITMTQTWPVRRGMATNMLRNQYAERLYPSEPLVTTQRIIDTFFPVALGGTGCIPGPFGAGKTVLQSLIAKYAKVDIVIIVACGERAGEVVETIQTYPETTDPRTGGSLMDRTIIICNTSSMPVAARESSIYTGITLAEYYRMMGYNVLLIADSTSRWAQAMRETSGRLEEIPGEEAFPAYLDSRIRSVYERAGVLKGPAGDTGSLTMIGTVSPAGGNFEEPVTQATLGTVKAFLGLSSERAYKRFYPAIDPLISWSRYLEQLAPWYNRNLTPTWTKDVQMMQALLEQGESINQMMQVVGEEGVTLEDYLIYQKATLIDMVYLQQDGFDDTDASMPQERQVDSFTLLKKIAMADIQIEEKDKALEFFTRLTGMYKNFNYASWGTEEYEKQKTEIEELLGMHSQ